MNVLTVSTVLCLCFAATLAEVTQFKDCGSKLATINSVNITPCPQPPPCPFKKNTFVNVSIDFTANVDIDAAKTSVHGILGPVPVKFPLPDDNACHFMKCPIKKGDKVTYKNGIKVLNAYPEIQLLVKWEILSGKDDVICFTVPVKIVK